MRISGYLSIYNDWDLLEPVLASVAGHLDELVVADGAYDWMAAWYAAQGDDPARSRQEVHDILRRSGIPIRLIEGPWASEVEKRTAAYAACTGDYVFRLDADEVIRFDNWELERFFASGGPLAETDMPLCVAPGWVHAPAVPGGPFPRMTSLFDRRQIGPREHLAYIWLISPGEQGLDQQAIRRHGVHRDPIGFATHLTTWRTARSQRRRAAFYVFNHRRHHARTGDGTPRFDTAMLSPDDIRDLLDRFDWQGTVSGIPAAGPSGFVRLPAGAADEGVLPRLFEQFAASHVERFTALRRRPAMFRHREPLLFEISTREQALALAPDGRLVIELLTCRAEKAQATVHSLVAVPPWNEEKEIPLAIDGQRISVDLSSVIDDLPLRRMLAITVTPDLQGVIHQSMLR